MGPPSAIIKALMNGETEQKPVANRFQLGTIVVAALLLAFVLGWNFRPALEDGGVAQQMGAGDGGEELGVAVTIDRGDGAVEEMPLVPYVKGDSVYSVMRVLNDVGLVVLSLADADVSLAAANVALTELAEDPEAAGWHFWVNDTYGTLSPQDYVVEPGDHIHFTFTPL